MANKKSKNSILQRQEEAVKNNPGKFPIGYLFALDHQDIADLRSKILTTSSEDAENEEVAPSFSKSRYAPTAFTERGLYMMATILSSATTRRISVG